MFSFKLLTVLLFYFFAKVEGGLENNVCTDWSSYHNKRDSPNCYHDPDVFANTPEVIDRHLGKGIYENYTVTTEDGYILTLFRILRKNPKGVIMLQHPILCDGVAWLSQGSDSLALKLWKLGYEVWLPNHRGTFFSEGHVNLTVHDFKYWSFSFDEIGLIDYPAFAEKISKVSNNTEIIFIGQSMACTSSIIYASVMPEHVKKHFKVFIQMAAPVYFKYVPTIARLFTPLEPILMPLCKLLGIGGLFYKNSISERIMRSLVNSPFRRFNVKILELNVGWTPEEYDPKLYPLVFSRLPRGAGLNVIWHYLQLVNNGGDHFRKFDYGITENFKRYKSVTPPEYPLENMEIPNYFITSKDDHLCDVKDNDLLWSKLQNSTKIYGRKITSGLNHADFFFGKHVDEYAFKYIFKLLNVL